MTASAVTAPKSVELPLIHVTQEDIEKIKGIVAERSQLLQMTTVDYAKSLPATQIVSKTSQISTYVTGGIAVGAAIGTGVGALGGPAAPITVPIGVGAGAAIGAVVGGVVGVVVVHKQTKKEFGVWKDKQNEKILAEFRNAFKEHPALEICIDPITCEPMTMPAHCACPDIQHTFDLRTLETHAKNHERCPISQRKLTVIDIRIDYRRMGEVSVAYKQLLQTGASLGKFSAKLMKGVEALSSDLEAHKVMVFKAERADINHQLDNTTDGSKIIMLTNRLAIIARLLHAPKSVGPGGATSSGTKS